MSSTEIVDCAKTLIDSYPEIDAEFPDYSLSSFLVKTEKS